MFWKDSGSRSSSGSGRDQNGVGPFGQVRVLIVGDSGVGKSSLLHLILKSSAIARPAQTVGCTVGVKHVTYGSAGGSSNNISDAERNFFVELLDVSGHERYKACRSIFYTQINGTCCVTLFISNILLFISLIFLSIFGDLSYVGMRIFPIVFF